MRRIVFGLLAVTLLGLFLVPHAPAQDATPSVEAGQITSVTLGSVPSTEAPGMNLVLTRVTLGPGAVIPAHVHPGQVIVTVESGTLAFTVVGEGQVLRAGVGTPTAGEAMPLGTEVMLEPGVWWTEGSDGAHTARNPGDEPTVLLVAALVAADQPFRLPVDMDMDMGTPTA
jgi:mannose-6-phosphate isomerase-like protein (cupin superfamily)